MNLEQARQNMVEQQIRTWEVLDQEVLDLLLTIRREDFVPKGYAKLAFAETAIPLGHGAAMLTPALEAKFLQALALRKSDKVLEIGTGSGFQSSLLSRIVRDAYTIEIIQPVGEAVGKIFAPLGYDNVHSRVGDGYFGWPEVEGGFDTIMLTCVAQYAPPELFRQLKPGGKLIIPIGQPFRRGQVLYVYTKDEQGRVHSRRDVGVFFIPMTGAMQSRARPTT